MTFIFQYEVHSGSMCTNSSSIYEQVVFSFRFDHLDIQLCGRKVCVCVCRQPVWVASWPHCPLAIMEWEGPPEEVLMEWEDPA